VSFDDDLDKIAKPDAKLRLIAIIPVVIIAGAMLAFMYGFRTEGRTYTTAAWRTHTVTEPEISFQIATPGMLMSTYQNMMFDGEAATAKAFIGSDMGTDFSLTIATRPDSDKRTIEQVAQSLLGMREVKPFPGVGGAPAVSADFVLEDTRTQARVIFKDRMLYQLMAVGPAKTFSEPRAQRFFDSFKLAGS
jgi:hypothetical protein